jgi:hypothetical protein
MRPIEVGTGVFFWGNFGGYFLPEDGKNIQADSREILHMLRHFRTLPDGWVEKMLEVGLTKEEIDTALAQPGSKWNPKIKRLETPESVLNLCQDILTEVCKKRNPIWVQKGKTMTCYVSYAFSKKDKKEMLETEESLGSDGLIALDALPTGLTVKEGTREVGGEHIPINVVEMNPVPTTDRIVVAVSRKNGRTRIWTAYPGIIVPRLPNRSQAPEERQYCQNFWQNHALVNERGE